MDRGKIRISAEEIDATRSDRLPKQDGRRVVVKSPDDMTSGERRAVDGIAGSPPACATCGEGINYAYAKRSPLPGICGRCLDKVRKDLRRELVKEGLGGTHVRSGSSVVYYRPRRAIATAFVPGLLVGAAGTLLTYVVAPAWFAPAAHNAEVAVRTLALWCLSGAAEVARLIG